MALETVPFRNPSNVDIFNAIRKNATIDYQRRIPAATKANVQDTIQNLLDYRPQMNEFIDSLVNRIGLEIVRYNSWTNPLAEFKRGMLEFGSTIEEINIGLLEAKRYDVDRDYLEGAIFGVEKPDVQSSFHVINRQDYYKLSVNETLLKRAFLAEYGLSSFIVGLMNAPTTSDNWDEFLLTMSLFKEYDRAGGFFNVQVPDLSVTTSDAADARYALRRFREFGDNLKFISTHYNASGMPVAASPDEMVLFVTPEAKAAMDVEALAAAFNIDRAEAPQRIIAVPKEHFGIDNVQGILTTRDFFVIADSRIDTTTAINPVGLHTNYFLHHHQVVSASRFVPAIKFTTEPSTVINLDNTPVTGITEPLVVDFEGVPVESYVTRGEAYRILVAAETTPEGGANDAVRFDITSVHNLRTYISQTGVLHVAPDEDNVIIGIDIIATDTDVPQLLSSIELDVNGPKLILWPNPEVDEDADLDGVFEVTPVDLVLTEDDTVVIPSIKGVQYFKAGSTVTNGSVHTIVGTVAFTAGPRVGYELAVGAPASWSFTV
jgi:hypothetical protein